MKINSIKYLIIDFFSNFQPKHSSLFDFIDSKFKKVCKCVCSN